MIKIDGELTDLNTYIKALNSHFHAGNKIKQEETERVYWEIKEQKTRKVTAYPVKITIHWYCENERKDIDNVSFAKKFILDGLVMAGIIENDSRKFVDALEDKFYIDKDEPRVEVFIESSNCG